MQNKKTFKELKKGDKIFIVNEGEMFGLRIEVHKIISIEKDKLKFVTNIKLDDTSIISIYDSLLSKTTMGFYFTNLEEAEAFFLEKSVDTYVKYMGKAAGYLAEYNRCVEIVDQMNKEIEKIKEKRNII